MSIRLRVFLSWASGAAMMLAAARIFVTHDATDFTYLGIPLAIAMLWSALAK